MATHDIIYTSGNDDTDLPGNRLETFATRGAHDRSRSPTRTIEQITFHLDRPGDTATLQIMPGGNDTVVNTDPDSVRVVEDGKEGRSIVFDRETSFVVVTEPDAARRPASSPFGSDDLSAIEQDKRIPTRVVITFPSGQDRP